MKKMLIGLLLVASVGTVVGCTDTKVVSKKGTEIVEETKEQVITPDFIDGKIGEERHFTSSDGEFIFKVNNVYLTDDRNQFADDPVNYVVIIEYSVTNINIAIEDFYFDLGYNAKFYDTNGSECDTYPVTVVDTFGVYGISPNRNSSSAVAIGITCDKPYLEMELGDVLYKFNL